MISVLILGGSNKTFTPLIDENESVSFLQVSESSDLLSLSYSWINGYFSKDKIYVVCTHSEVGKVKKSCKGINEANIIVEPEKINNSVSIFFASMVVEKIDPEETVLFFPVGIFFPPEFKMGKWLYKVEEITEKDWVVIPTVLLNRNDKDVEYIDSGKVISTVKSLNFFVVNSVNSGKEKIKKKRFFGKQGRFLNIICGKSNSILQLFADSDVISGFFKMFYKYFRSKQLDWESIKEKYQKRDNDVDAYNIILKNRNFLIIFLDTKPIYIDNWGSFLERFSSDKNLNLKVGNISITNCKKTICYNFDKDVISIKDIEEVVICKKNGNTVIKSIYER